MVKEYGKLVVTTLSFYVTWSTQPLNTKTDDPDRTRADSYKQQKKIQNYLDRFYTLT